MHKETIEIIRPFGPSILKATLPNDMINDLNQECLDISNNKKGSLWEPFFSTR